MTKNPSENYVDQAQDTDILFFLLVHFALYEVVDEGRDNQEKKIRPNPHHS